MQKNKIIFNRSSEECKKFLCDSVYYKKCEACIHNSGMSIKNRNELKKCNSRCSPNEFICKLFNYLPISLYNKVMTSFIKLIRIYELFILQFTVVMANQEETGKNNNIINSIKEYPSMVWNKYTELLEKICNGIGLENKYNEEYIAIPVAVFAIVLFFCIICLICYMCCCKKSCCKKKESDNSDVDCEQFIMGPSEQMYNAMYQGQMMQPQMISGGMAFPQMYPQMYYQQMY
ncbi:hypothetical protein PCYB_002410 [Plasmodium cynomolgi strain B]|uniref:Uncharacterized protein n=1 Tax=Plasmodium cynomolgi (strain B) TaxID=1120755 RepID=K6VJC8_PLACD|nr:hypothetical protein PCYB_002410 [Plasmodium cynomolgi strain B]GAB69492.1 hypothetical protein PCYB_002410 [Plasmodium cynomolgi strain B]